jgi:hypothetical protein
LSFCGASGPAHFRFGPSWTCDKHACMLSHVKARAASTIPSSKLTARSRAEQSCRPRG